ncbi:10379_t:CDS:2, partial [Racocetra persica]
KKRELKQLKIPTKNKLEDNNLPKNLLTGCQAGTSQKRTFKLIENQLQQAKERLQTKVTTEEINQLCQLQTEITSLEIKLEQEQAQGEEELVAKIEISSKFESFPRYQLKQLIVKILNMENSTTLLTELLEEERNPLMSVESAALGAILGFALG